MKELLQRDFSNDILQVIPKDRIEKFIEITKQNIPKAIHAHHYLSNHRRWERIVSKDKQLKNIISPKCNRFLFAPRNGKVENCTFIAVPEEAYDESVDVSILFIGILNGE